MSLEITPPPKAALRKLYYKEDCDQNGWAYVSLENIHNSKDNILAFIKGARRINIKLMDKTMQEVKETSRSANGGFVFEYLACRVGQQSKYDGVVLANPTAYGTFEFAGSGLVFHKRSAEPFTVTYTIDAAARPLTQ